MKFVAVILATALLASACATAPPTLILEAAQVVPWQTPPRRLLVALPGSTSIDPIQLGAALQRELAVCGIEADIVTDAVNSELSLEADSMERMVDQRLRQSRPDGLLLVMPRALRAHSADFKDRVTITYSVVITELTTRKPIFRAAAQFNQKLTANAGMQNLGRLLVREMARAGAMRCPDQRA